MLVLPHVVVGYDPASPGYTIFAARERGTHRLEIVQVVDGYGRVVAAPRPPARAEIAAVVEKAQPRVLWSMQFKTTTPFPDELRALIFGKET